MSVRVENRYTEAYGPHEVMLKINGINIYMKTTITCDKDLVRQIYVGREELKVRSIGLCAMLEEDSMDIGIEADVSPLVLDISGNKTQLRGVTRHGSGLECYTNRNLGANGLRQRRLDRLENTAVSCKKMGAAGTRQDTNNSPKLGGTQPVDELPCGGKPR